MAERTLDVLQRYDVLTRERLLELLESARGRPHLSLHLNVNPAVRTLKEARLQVRAMAERRLAWVPPEQRQAYWTAVEAAHRELEGIWAEPGQGLALYHDGAGEFVHRFRLPLPPSVERLDWGPRPNIKPLVTLLEEYEPWAVVLVDKRRGRLLLFYLGSLVEVGDVVNPDLPRKHKQGLRGSNARLQRHHQTHVIWHVKRVLAALEDLVETYQVERIALGGPPEALAELKRRLSPALEERVMGEVTVATVAELSEVQREVEALRQRTEAAEEEAAVSEVFTAAAKGQGGVVGVEPTLRALYQGRVGRLLYVDTVPRPGRRCPSCTWVTTTETEVCPLCGEATVPVEDVFEWAVRRALLQDGEIEAVRHDPGRAQLLDEAEGMAAFLRF